MSNLLSAITSQFDDNMIGKVAGFIGESKSNTGSAITSMIPTFMSSMINKGSTESGAGSLLNMIKEGGHDGSMMDNLSGILSGGGASDSLLKSGGSIVSSLLGGNSGSIISKIAGMSGIGSASGNKLMSFLAPMVMGFIGKKVSSQGLGAKGLMNLLSGQKSYVDKAVPAGISSMLGFADTGAKIVDARTSSTSTTTTRHDDDNNGGGLGWLKWLLLGLAALLLIGWFLKNKMGGSSEGSADKTEIEATSSTTTSGDYNSTTENRDPATGDNMNTRTATTSNSNAAFKIDVNGNLVDKAGKIIAKAGSFKVNADGNLVDMSGNVLAKAGNFMQVNMDKGGDMAKKTVDAVANVGTYKVDASGNLVDANGKVVFKSGEFSTDEEGYYVDKSGNRIGKVFKKVGQAIATGATKTADAFKGVFSKMFKKEAGASTNYTLSDIVFDPKSQRITNFSKEEVEGLAQALKANADAKIDVQYHTADGKNGAANKKLSTMRAKVIEDMLTTLGVNAKQISSSGMGDGDAAKAKGNKVDIVVK